jgi:hypothetical protein
MRTRRSSEILKRSRIGPGSLHYRHADKDVFSFG